MTSGGEPKSEPRKPPGGCLIYLISYLAAIAIIVLASTLGDPAPDGIVFPALSAAALLVIVRWALQRFRPVPRHRGVVRPRLAELAVRAGRATPLGTDAVAVSRSLLHSPPFVVAALLLIAATTAVTLNQPAKTRSGQFDMRFDALLVAGDGQGDLSRIRLHRMDFRVDPNGPDGTLRASINTVVDLSQFQGRFRLLIQVPVGAVPNREYWPPSTLPGEQVTHNLSEVHGLDKLDPEVLQIVRPVRTVFIDVDSDVLAHHMRSTYPDWTSERVGLPTVYLDIPKPAGVRREGLGVRSYVIEMGRTTHVDRPQQTELRIGEVTKADDIADGARLVVGLIPSTDELRDDSLEYEGELEFDWTRPEPGELGEGYRAWPVGPRGEQVEFALVTSRRLAFVGTYAVEVMLVLLSYCLARVGQAWVRQRGTRRSPASSTLP